MKGIIFVKFCEFVEDGWSDTLLDRVIIDSKVPSRGIYVTTMTYDDSEILALIGTFSDIVGLSIAESLVAFGRWVFSHLYQSLPHHENRFITVFDSLRAVQSVIHVDVKKLNPEVILPEFTFLEETENRLLFEYQSPRHLHKLCEGLILGLSDHTHEKVTINHYSRIHKNQQQHLIEVVKLDG